MHGWGLGNIKHVLLTGAVVAGLLAIPPTVINAGAPAAAAACANEIACENERPGTDPEIWDISGAGDPSIQGFATEISVNRGSTIDFKIDTDSSDYTIEIYRTGYYQGLGARRVAGPFSPSASLPQVQPNCLNDVTTRLYDCGTWGVSASWSVPSDAVSGVYFARLIRSDPLGDSHIPFIVRDDDSHSDLVFQTSDTTWQAYNRYGGSDYYSNPRAFSLSYNRPIVTRGGVTRRDFYFGAEYPLVRFLERNGYDVSYIAGPDTDRRPELLANHKTFLSVGHDEYWSGRQRANVVAARDAGVNLMFLSGNEMYWRVRWENDHRTITSYKETWGDGPTAGVGSKIDPVATEWTGTWRDPRFAPQSTGAGLPENAVTGTLFVANRSDLPVTVDAREGRLRLWRNTDLAGQAAGTRRALTPSTVGYESDQDVDNGFRPPGLIRLSTTTGPGEVLTDFGNTVDVNGATTHHLTMYRAASGALVFGAGTVQWTWGLDAEHDFEFGPPVPDPAMQQAQINLLADFGAQPTTLMAGMSTASPSTDTTGPTVTVDAPGPQANGNRVTLTGTAHDVGGQVAGVEVSTDRGTTWHAAEGTTDWSYTYTQHGYGARAVRARAIDDSANIGSFRARHPAVSCPCSIFGDEVPKVPAVDDDNSSYELGLRFVPMRDGRVTGVRFYKGTGNGGAHVGRLWTAGGVLLAQAPFTAETPTGWQTVPFANPVEVQKDQTYVVSYSVPQGNYAAQQYAFDQRGVEADPLSVPGGFAGGDSGVLSSTVGAFPDQTFRNTNYYVDVTFEANGAPDSAPTLDVTDRQPSPGATGVATSAAVSVELSAPVEPGYAMTLRAGPTPIPGSVTTSQGGRRLTFTPSAALPDLTQVTVDLTGVLSVDGVDLDPQSWTFTTAAAPPSVPPSVPPSGTPGTPGNPGNPGNPDPDNPGTGRTATLFGNAKPEDRPSAARGTEVGVEFTPTANGEVAALRYFQVRGNAVPRSVTLWSAGGKRLARAKVPSKGAKPNRAGWRTVTLPTPIALRAGRSYVASYFLPSGRAARTTDFYPRKVWKSGPLKAKRSGNGRFVDSRRSRFPKRVAPGVNFFADVRFVYQGQDTRSG